MNFISELNIQPSNPGVSTGSSWLKTNGEIIKSFSPVDGKLIASVTTADKNGYEQVVLKARQAFEEWRQ